MKLLALLILFVSSSLHAAEQSQDQVLKNLFQDKQYKSAQAYLDILLQQKTFDSPEEKIRLLLMNALAAGYAKNFARAYQLLEEGRNLLEWTGFRDRLTYDTKSRERISQSIELLAHDLRAMEGSLP
jgi:predicted Zn-dependent peptidase